MFCCKSGTEQFEIHRSDQGFLDIKDNPLRPIFNRFTDARDPISNESGLERLVRITSTIFANIRDISYFNRPENYTLFELQGKGMD
jgi:hypothetical protein